MRWTILLVMATAGCASTRANISRDLPPLPPICPEGVAVYPDSTAIGKPYKRVAELSSQGSLLFPDENAIFDSQRKKAAELGANGVILLLGNLTSQNGTSAKAIAIFIPGDSARVAAVCRRR